MSHGMVAFLEECVRKEPKVDLHLTTGTNFTKVLVTGVMNGTCEVTKVMSGTRRAWVVNIEHIVWGSVTG